jgi:hypothetical protein
MDYTLIQTVSAKSFMEANGVSLLSEYDSSTVGLFSRSYVRFAMACRETLVDRILESKGYWDLMTSSMPVLLVISAVYFGLVGVLLNVLQIIYVKPINSCSPPSALSSSMTTMVASSSEEELSSSAFFAS